jgi:PPP family 3-phenylpropionic acid transporter
MPNTVLYFLELGFNGVQIGILAGIAPIITMIGAPLWTGLADSKYRHKLIMSVSILAVVLLSSIFPLVKTLIPIMLLVCMFSLFSSPIPSFADSATMAMLARKKEMYGRVRLGGTIGFGLAAPLVGIIIQSYGISWAFWGYAVMMFLAFIISQKFVFEKKAENEALNWDIRWVLNNRRWVYFLILAFIGGMAFSCINSYLFPYMAELGASRTTMGIALMISTLVELPVLFFSHLLLKRFKAYGLFILGIMITGIRLLLYAIFNFTAGILFFQLLNGMTFPMMWVAGVSFADENAPPGMKSTAQGLFGAMVLGIGAAIGNLLGGLMLGSIGGRWMYLILGSLVLVSMIMIAILERLGRPRQARSTI